MALKQVATPILLERMGTALDALDGWVHQGKMHTNNRQWELLRKDLEGMGQSFGLADGVYMELERRGRGKT